MEDLSKLGSYWFVGPLPSSRIKIDGAMRKNQEIFDFLEQKVKVRRLNTSQNRIFLFFRILECIRLISGRHRVVVACNTESAKKVLRILTVIQYFNKDVVTIYFVVGGSLSRQFKLSDLSILSSAACVYYEDNKGAKELAKLGLLNVSYLPNFRSVPDIPFRKSNDKDSIRYVFCSRVAPSKGIIELVDIFKSLSHIKLDIYGPIENGFELEFNKAMELTSNISYCGILDLSVNDGYLRLQQYDVLLFPTKWIGEGFPGVFLDSFIAGLAVLASNWHLNGKILEKTDAGRVFEDKDQLKEILTSLKKSDVEEWRRNSFLSREFFKTEYVLTKTVLFEELSK